MVDWKERQTAFRLQVLDAGLPIAHVVQRRGQSNIFDRRPKFGEE